MDDDEAVGAGDLLERLHHGHLQPVFSLGIERVKADADEEGQHLGVGLGAEFQALFLQLPLERPVILDHPVVHDGPAVHWRRCAGGR